MRTVLALLIGVLLYMQYTLWFGKGGIRDVRMMRDQIDKQHQEIAVLKERNQSLAAEVLDLKEGLEAIEERARSEMGMIKQDEVFYQVIEPRNIDNKQGLSSGSSSQNPSE